MKFLRKTIVHTGLLQLGCVAVLMSCVTQHENLATVPKVDIDQFMGDWYVQGHTPLFIDEDSSDQRESYQLDSKGRIDTEFSFKKKGEWHHYHPQGTVYNRTTNAHWKMQFLWPFSSDFLIVRLDPQYSYTVISVPDKENIWIMSRQRQMQEVQYQSIVDDLARESYPVKSIRRVPQSQDPIPRGH